MNDNKIVVRWFCGCFIATLIILVSYLCYSITTFKNSQERIVTEHLEHLANVDSIFYDIKRVILGTDSVTIANAPVLLAQLQNDSALMRREIMLSQEEKMNLVALHIDKIDNDYSQIGIWGGILSIIFLIFGFFAIFKIEETKAEAKSTLEDVKNQKEKASAEIKELQEQAAQVNESYNSIRQSSETFIADSTQVFNELITTINTDYSQAQESLERINKLLVEVESKNKQYDLSIKQMNGLMGQLGQLIDRLNKVTNDGNDTDHE